MAPELDEPVAHRAASSADERSDIRDHSNAAPGYRGACHRAALCADPLAHPGYACCAGSVARLGGSLGLNAALPFASHPP